jgi:hypothetical protein
MTGHKWCIQSRFNHAVQSSVNAGLAIHLQVPSGYDALTFRASATAKLLVSSDLALTQASPDAGPVEA